MWKEAETFLSKDKYVGPLIKTWGSCTIKFKPHKDYFAHIAGNIIGQQLSGRVADIIEERFVKAVGGKVTPDNILNTPDQALRDCGMSWGKVSYVKDLADKVKRQEVKVKSLNKLDDNEIIENLIKVKGIGRWTVEMFLMFSLARPDIFPVDDLGIKKGFEKVTGRTWDRVNSPKFAQKHWSPYRTVASWYLWRSLENR
jgi:DNA-3-methyladenine glycosylase II